MAADGRGRWARGSGAYWKELEESGDFELTEEESAQLAEIISKAWSSEVEYPPSSVKGSRVIILRDGETARVFEHSAVPSSLEPLEDIMLRHVPSEDDEK